MDLQTETFASLDTRSARSQVAGIILHPEPHVRVSRDPNRNWRVFPPSRPLEVSRTQSQNPSFSLFRKFESDFDDASSSDRFAVEDEKPRQTAKASVV